MSVPDSRQLGAILIDIGVLRQGQLQAVLAEQRRSGGKLGTLLLDREAVSAVDLAHALAIQKGLDFLPDESLVPEAEALGLLDAGTARAFGALPLGL